MRILSLLVIACIATSVAAQTSHRGLGFEMGVTYAHFGLSAKEDNILDRERGNALAFSAAMMWHDSLRTGWKGVSMGAVSEVLWWEEELLIPIFFQMEVRPWAQARPVFQIRPDRISINMRIGGVVGAWKETTTGQLTGGQYLKCGLRYGLNNVSRRSTWLEIGSAMLAIRGKYLVRSECVWKEEDPDFLSIQIGLGVAW
jgi:hypothetical protein